MTKTGSLAGAVIAVGLLFLLTGCSATQQSMGGAGQTTPMGNGISTKDETGRPFDAVSGTFQGLTETGELRVMTGEGTINVRPATGASVRRGTTVILPEQLSRGEKIDAVGQIQDGTLVAQSIAIGSGSIDGTVVSVQSERLVVEESYTGEETTVFTESRTQVIDRDGNSSAWQSDALRAGARIYAIGYLNEAEQFILERIWLGD